MPGLDTAPSVWRGPVARGLAAAAEEQRIEPEGGRFGAGLIRGFSVITRGEAFGHEMWIDHVMLSQVAEALNGMKEGLKSRFAHPDMSGDGIGTSVGKAFNARVEGDRVLADLHILQSAHEAPDGDLGSYVMQLAQEAPDSFGTSIAFYADRAAEKAFEAEHTDDQGRFVSPDKKNRHNFRHVRLRNLRAVDVVDEPAANPEGMFHAGPFELLEAGDRVLEFVFGLSDQAPPALAGMDPTRLKGFVGRFCESNGLSFSKSVGEPMKLNSGGAAAQDDKPADSPEQPAGGSTETPAPDQPAEGSAAPAEGQAAADGAGESAQQSSKPTDQSAEFRTGLKTYMAEFGKEQGAEWYAEGLTFEQAKDRHRKQLQDQNKALQEKLSAVGSGLGEKEPLSGGQPKETPEDKYQGAVSSGIARYAASVKVPGQN